MNPPPPSATTTTHWQVRSAEYLESDVRQEDSSSKFQLPDEWWLGDGPIDADYRPLIISMGRSPATVPDFFYHDVLPFVSDRCKRVVEAHGRYSGEFHRASLTTDDGRIWEPYWYFRLLTRLDAVDMERSEIEFFPGTARPKRIWQLRLDTPALQGHDMFRLNKIEAIFVAGELKSAMEAADLHVRFSPAEDFRLGW